VEERFDLIELGRVIHEERFRREAKENQIARMKIDLFSKEGYVHETQFSKKVIKEHKTQPLFYACYLKHVLGFDRIRAQWTRPTSCRRDGEKTTRKP
jgi:CRISPR-associated exonuclease Cas4